MAPLILPGQTTQQPQYPATVPAIFGIVPEFVWNGGSQEFDAVSGGLFTRGSTLTQTIEPYGGAIRSPDNLATGCTLLGGKTTVQTKFTFAAVFTWESGAGNQYATLLASSTNSTGVVLQMQSPAGGFLGLTKQGVVSVGSIAVNADEPYFIIVSHRQDTGETYLLLRSLLTGGITRATANNTNLNSAGNGTYGVGYGDSTFADSWKGRIGFGVMAFDFLPESEANVWLQNPWQIFSAQPRRIWIPGATVQILRPASDISAGAWTPSAGGSLFATINETPFNDATYNTTPSASTFEVKLGAGTSPGVTTGHIARYRARGTGSLTVRLMQGATVIATNTPSITAAYQTFTFTLSGAEAAAITDYSDLRLRFTST